MRKTAEKHIFPILHKKIKKIQTNLASWTSVAWLTYWLIVPLILFMIWSLSPEIKSTYFILDTAAPHWTSIILSSYTHSEIYHLGNNIGLYLLSLAMIFTCCSNPKLLHYSSIIMFIAVPVFASAVTMHLSETLNIALYSQGFSAIAYAYTALGLYSFFSLALPGIPPLPFEKSSFHPYPKRYIMALFVIIGTVIIIVAHGLSAGAIVTNNGSFVNGPAHVIGYFSGIFIISLVDIRLKTNNIKINYLFILFGTFMIIPYLLVLK